MCNVILEHVDPKLKLFDVKEINHPKLGRVLLEKVRGIYWDKYNKHWIVKTSKGTNSVNPKNYPSKESARVNACRMRLDYEALKVKDTIILEDVDPKRKVFDVKEMHPLDSNLKDTFILEDVDPKRKVFDVKEINPLDSNLKDTIILEDVDPKRKVFDVKEINNLDPKLKLFDVKEINHPKLGRVVLEKVRGVAWDKKRNHWRVRTSRGTVSVIPKKLPQ